MEGVEGVNEEMNQQPVANEPVQEAAPMMATASEKKSIPGWGIGIIVVVIIIIILLIIK